MGCDGGGDLVVTDYTMRNEYDDFGRAGRFGSVVANSCKSLLGSL